MSHSHFVVIVDFEQVNVCWEVKKKIANVGLIHPPNIKWRTKLRGEKDLSTEE